MDRIIGVTELRRGFRSVLDEVVRPRVSHSLTRGGRPEAAWMPYSQYVRFIRAGEAGVLHQFDVLLARMAEANAQHAEGEMEADLRAASRTTWLRPRK